MFCSKCGTQIKTEAKYCYKCGSAVATNTALTELKTLPKVEQKKEQISKIGKVRVVGKKMRIKSTTKIACWIIMVVSAINVLSNIYGLITNENQQANIFLFVFWLAIFESAHQILKGSKFCWWLIVILILLILSFYSYMIFSPYLASEKELNINNLSTDDIINIFLLMIVIIPMAIVIVLLLLNPPHKWIEEVPVNSINRINGKI